MKITENPLEHITKLNQMLEPHLSFDLISKRNKPIFVSLYYHQIILLASKCTPLVIVSLKRSPMLKIKQKKRFLKCGHHLKLCFENSDQIILMNISAHEPSILYHQC